MRDSTSPGALIVDCDVLHDCGLYDCDALHEAMDGVDFLRSKLPSQLGGKSTDSYNPVTKEQDEKEGGYDEF